MPDRSEGAGSRKPAAKKSAKRASFDPRVLDRTVIARPLMEELKEKGDDALVDIVIDLNLNFPGGRDRARERVRDRRGAGVDERKTQLSDQYVFARLPGRAIRAMVRLDAESVGGASSAPNRVIFRILP